MADNQSDHELRNSNTTLLQKLASAVNGHAATATFACGGSLPISDPSPDNFSPGAQDLVPPVTIRWDSKDSYLRQSKIAFPPPYQDDVSGRMLSSLLHHCQPATFGVGGRDVLDEEYRKAGKLDTSEFSTNFHPHDYGILDSIQQILLPSTIRGGQGVGIGPQGVRAELYKLNIYSAPSGKFLSHVDTPRGVLQFGSLVVCLPCQHEGGVLRVKHRGETVDFAWGHTGQHSLQWAAFYGDCEHEVLEVTQGHRITLTYNLYYTSIGKLAQPVSDPHHLPLYDIAREMLLQQKFMRRGEYDLTGGILGFFCHHQYAHSQESGRKSIPGAFKGVDLAVFSVFHALGLKVGVHPIIENNSNKIGGLSAKRLMRGPTVPRRGDFVENCLKKLSRGGDDDGNSETYYFEKEEEDTIVGTHLHSPTIDSDDDEDVSKEPVSDAWPHQRVPQIIWMNSPQHQDFAYAGLAYGNQATLSYRFSAAAILIIVPASDDDKRRSVIVGRNATTCLPSENNNDNNNNNAAAAITSPSTNSAAAAVTTPPSSSMSMMSMSTDDDLSSSNASPGDIDDATLGSNPCLAPSYSNCQPHIPSYSNSNPTSESTRVAESSDPGLDMGEVVPDEWSATGSEFGIGF